MKKYRVAGRIAATIAAATLLASVAYPASATSTDIDQEDYGISVRMNGEMVSLTEDEVSSILAEYTSTESLATEGDAVATPMLIGFPDWTACFTFNAEETTFAEWNFAWDGALKPVRLKCGNDSWGYKHIKKGKESAWLTQLNKARTYGWDGTGMGINNWDDLMALGAGIALTYPDDVRTKSSENIRCAATSVYLTEGNSILYVFNTRVGFATNNDRLLTAFPQSSNLCPKTTGWS